MHMCKLKHSEKQLSDFRAVHRNRVGSVANAERNPLFFLLIWPHNRENGSQSCQPSTRLKCSKIRF